MDLERNTARLCSVIYIRENVACPHQEGLDYPIEEDGLFFPSWQGNRAH